MCANTSPAMDRRTFLRTAAAATAVVGVGGSAVGTGAAQQDTAAWFSNVSNYDGVADRTGQSEVTVEVGAQGNGGGFAFGPAAVRVDPGTTVVWEWTGKGGVHNVADEAGSFTSEYSDEAGYTFSHTFDAEGVALYSCVPHKAMGMKGAVVVGGAMVGGTLDAEPDYDGWLDDVPSYDGTVDASGTPEVTVDVGVGPDGEPAFDPPAVKVDPGTTVVWEWTGVGGEHAVVDPDHGFESPHFSEAGATYSLTFDGEGVSKYSCPGHVEQGMKGVVVVGDVVESQQAAARDAESATWVLLVLAALSPLGVSYFLPKHEPNSRPPYERD